MPMWSRSKDLKNVFLKELAPEKNKLTKAREALQKAIDTAKAARGNVMEFELAKKLVLFFICMRRCVV